MTETTIAAAADKVSDTLKSVETWQAFYDLTNNYEEPRRASVSDVLAVRDAVRATLSTPSGQDEYDAAGYSTLTEGRSFLVGVSPGIIRARSSDRAAADRTADRNADGHKNKIDAGMVVDPETGEITYDDAAGPSSTEITSWSRQSRAHMTKTLLSLDFSDWSRNDGALAMVTLTLPGNWKPLAPDGKTFKKLLRKFEHRWRRNVGPWRLLWKLEFQRRGAPHWHALMRVPAMVTADGGYGKGYGTNEQNGWAGITETFETWLARTWADCVGASRDIDTIDADGREHSEYSRHYAAHLGHAIDFSGQDFSDPRRISMYFAGHSAKSQDGKEYQNVVPPKWQRPGAGPGRFWGFAGFESALVEVEVTQQDFDRLRREMRKLARARSWEIAVKRAGGAAKRGGYTPPRTFNVRAPKLRRSMLGGGGGQNGGWVMLNDALPVFRGLARWLAAPVTPEAWAGFLPADNKTRKSFRASDASARFVWDLEFSRLEKRLFFLGA